MIPPTIGPATGKKGLMKSMKINPTSADIQKDPCSAN